ncbi:myosin heavy chain-related protein [Artemisia annua]|uniref:Myosin heavy chain-related protein n=1 Tax=Artemisia annua TaxID=35608 RepID=A0A2U1NGZ8_ARTAN|nr:myosin heavy chain-related protein [Artemisia annua]
MNKLILISCIFALIILSHQIVRGEGDDESGIGSGDSDSGRVELDQLNSKIHHLESLVHKKSEELRTKDEIIAGKEKAIVEKEKVIKEKSDNVASLRSEVASLKVKGSSDAKEQVKKAHTRAQELEKQVEKLQLELDLKAGLREVLETRTKELEKKMLEVDPKIQDLQKTIEEQKTKLLKTERALKVAEEELMKTNNEAAQKIKELTEVHTAWLPPWLAAQLASSQSYLEARWIEHGKPALETFTQKALEKKAQAEKWAEPHIETVKTKWIPAAKEQWVILITNVEPHIQLATERTKNIYVQSKEVLTPHVTKVKEAVDPHFQVAKKFCKPYIDQVAVAAKPHLEKARETIKPYTNEAVLAYGKFLESATKYHDQVRATVEESLQKHDVTRPLATNKEFIWFAASAFLALPIIILFRTFSGIFFGTTKKPIKNTKPTHTRRKAKRGHSDK